LTGVSGSGKSSLAFDTLYAEGQRRYVESLSSFARQFLGQLPKPDVDLIAGLSPSISISQKSSGNNPRSTVGTITEIHDFLRVLYARVGQGFCPNCDLPIALQTIDQVVASVCQIATGSLVHILAPVVRGQKGQHRDLFDDLRKQGFVRARVDGRIVSLDAEPELDRQMRHDIEVVIDRFELKPASRTRLAEAVELSVKLGEGNLIVTVEGAGAKPNARGSDPTHPAAEHLFSTRYSCPACGGSFDPPSPQMFSFNSPRGMCGECDGLGEIFSFDPALLIAQPARSLKGGCIELLGPWKELGRWRRHIFQGVADTVERIRQLPAGTLLDTAWRDLSADLQRVWLWGTGDQHITFTWRGGSSPMKYGGKFEGIIPDLMSRYLSAKSPPLRRQLEAHMSTIRCGACGGQRLNRQARAVRIESRHDRFRASPRKSLPEVGDLSIRDAVDFFSELSLDATRAAIAVDALKEIRARLGFLLNVGLDYLTLNRTAPTLSGGESQRIRLASQIGSGLVGVLYILDEPSIGLHARDNDRLIATLQHLRDLGNTVVVVEHDEETIRAADHVIDFGPGAGTRGGRVVASGSAQAVESARDSVTGQFLSGRRRIEVPAERRRLDPNRALRVIGARHNNLQDIDVAIPLGGLVCITGVSGSGKSSLVNDILVEVLREKLNGGIGSPGRHERIEGLEHLDKMIAIDQSPIGRTPRSNPGTYIKVFDEIRALFARLPEAKRRGFNAGRFSFNMKSGRCGACEGNAANKLEMDFLADIWVTCPVCQGQRFNRETLQVKYKERSIAEVLDMDVEGALEFFANVPKIHDKLQTLHDVGLEYLRIGQPSPTLSGGEAQRIKLAREFVKRSTGRTLYLLDEPTTGLHFADIQMLLRVLHGFVEGGNTVLVVEHNLDVIKTADWVIDLGPEGGAAGGRIVAAGTPEQIADCPASYTGQALQKVFAPAGQTQRRATKPAEAGPPKQASVISVRGAEQHNLKSVSTEIPRERMTVFCGPSGSGKSSLAMDTIYAEGQRRYVESLSSYARQFVDQMQKPRVEHIDGLSPAIAIEQKNLGNTPRSTVGTVTEVYDFFRVLYARLGTPYCPQCDVPVGTQTADQIVDKIMRQPAGTKLYLLAPVEPAGQQSYDDFWSDLRRQGFVRVRIDGKTYGLDDLPELNRRQRYSIQVVVDRIAVQASDRSRIADSVESSLAIGRGLMFAAHVSDQPESQWLVQRHSQHLACEQCGQSYERLSPHHFSFNSPLGWCPDCQGLGIQIGANPNSMLRSPDLALRDGALWLWPDLQQPLAKAMLRSLADATQIPLDLPFNQLDARHRRAILFGTGERWIPVDSAAARFAFQFKGVFPALEEASRLSPSIRQRMMALIDEVECGACLGSRLRLDAAAFRFREATLDQICRTPLARLSETIERWRLDSREQKIAGEIMREIKNRLEFLVQVGLEYLTLGRAANTLSNGEAQRIRLASQLGSGLCGVLYVLDEPTVGLHPRDNRRLLQALHRLRDLGNTLLVVEHDREVIASADEICDFGPRAGQEGGEIVAQAPPDQLPRQRGSVTGPYLSGQKSIPIPENRRRVLSTAPNGTAATGPRRKGSAATQTTPPPATTESSVAPMAVDSLKIVAARHHNLKSIDVSIPLGVLTVVTGPSGCGKSSLVNDVLFQALAQRLHRATVVPGGHDRIEGLHHINKVIRVDQSPLGNTPTSTPATYTGAFDLIRELFAHLPAAKVRGFSARRFSFNVPGGRCEECEGNGQRRIEMHFLPDVWVPCEACQSRRYNEETLAVQFHGHSINDVLEMTCGQAVKLFGEIAAIRRILQTLCDVGLDYVRLGQSAPTLSGGEAQRVKLAAELARPDTGRTLYLLDEPTTGLHFDDLAKLLEVLHRLVDSGNSVVLIEHNLDVIKCADWVIDMGPEAGADGGQVVVAGTPETIAEYGQKAASPAGRRQKLPRSYTGEFLAEILRGGQRAERKSRTATPVPLRPTEDFRRLAGDTAMPWEKNGRRWHTKDRVGRDGKPARWDGEILSRLVDYVGAHAEFSDPDWSQRSVVEIAAENKSLGWFLHAITGETWLLKLKFRVRRGTFKRDDLQARLPLKTLNELDDIPRYGNEPRVEVRQRGAVQEIEIRAHSLAELDIPAFWKFVDEAIAGFQAQVERLESNADALAPWSKLGQEWHLLRKGFPSGQDIAWEPKLLEELVAMLNKLAPHGTWLWGNKQIVHLTVAQQREPWISIQTKKCDALWLHLTGPKHAATLGRIANLGSEPAVAPLSADREVAHLKIQSLKQVRNPDLLRFLTEHLLALTRQARGAVPPTKLHASTRTARTSRREIE
jgi:excinuclease ABC subunit A